jgi:hypothetical protein
MMLAEWRLGLRLMNRYRLRRSTSEEVVLAEHLPEGDQIALPMAERRALADLGRTLHDRVGFRDVQAARLSGIPYASSATLARQAPIELSGPAGGAVDVAIDRLVADGGRHAIQGQTTGDLLG